LPSTSEKEALGLALKLDEYNTLRQEIEKHILKDAINRLEHSDEKSSNAWKHVL